MEIIEMAKGKKGLIRGILALLFLALILGLINFSVRGIPLVDRRYKTVEYARLDSLNLDEGVHLVGIDAARAFVEGEKGWVLDARDQGQYDSGHIPGAVLCNVYQLEQYLSDILNRVPMDSPVMVYCNGEDCEDSRFLAQSLQEAGYLRLLIFTGGFGQWEATGLPVEKAGDNAPADNSEKMNITDFSLSVPHWMWLVLDILLLASGLAVAAASRTGWLREDKRAWVLSAVGVVFLAASVHKLAAPVVFARAVDNYRLLPWYAINPVAMIMPWTEFLGGLLLILRRFRQPAAAILMLLTCVFILAVGFNLARGLQFDCGCFGGAHTSPWQVLARDAGLFLCLLSCFPDKNKKRTESVGRQDIV